MMLILTTPHRRRTGVVFGGAVLLAAAGAAQAQIAREPIEPPVPKAESKWEGAIGANFAYGVAYPGSDEAGVGATPGIFLRYGRYTLSSGSSFATRRDDDALRGLGVDLSRDERVKIGLSVRLDRGRNEESADALRGMGDIDATLRARVSVSWQLHDQWRLGGAWTVDAFGRGGGNLGDIGVAYEKRWTPDTVTNYGLKFTLAGGRYMQTYYGVTEEQAARTGYPVYTPDAGPRNVELTAGVRTEITPRWAALAGVGVLYVMGPAADSPLTRRRTNWGLSSAFAWRF